MAQDATAASLMAPRRDAVERFWEKVDKTEDCWLWTAYTLKGYGMFKETHSRSPVYAHRFAYEMLVGPIPDGLELDHRHTCEKRCVRPEHLRPVTGKQNKENRPGAQRNSQTGVRGVSLHASGRYVAQIKHHGKKMYLGLYDTIGEAEAVVVAKRLELFTHNDLDRAS